MRKSLAIRHFTAVPRTAVFLILFPLILFGALTLKAAWIPLKASIAQWLIEQDWRQRIEEHANGEMLASTSGPWPWSDTRSAARLHAPALDLYWMVLEGNSGRNLAFGPTFSDGTANGLDVIINGHRDTHFARVGELGMGDLLSLTRFRNGRLLTERFEVTQLEIIDSSDRQLVIEPGTSRLSLVTCYPFDAARAGGSLRYVVTAQPVRSLKRSVSSG